MSEAFVTLATNDGYALGALVLGQSIRKAGTKKVLAIMITDQVSDLLRRNLEATFDNVITVNLLDSKDEVNLKLMERPELGITFTKFNCWRLTQYTKCVFLDADCVVLRSIDDLFDREELSAAPDAGWPDIFNSGVFVFKPSQETYDKLMKFTTEQQSFDGGDQGLLNKFFSDWSTADISRHIPFTYNVTSNTFYSYLPAVKQFRNEIRLVHFAGTLKPWQLTYDPNSHQLSGYYQSYEKEFLMLWWTVMYDTVWPHLSATNQEAMSPYNPFEQRQGGPINYGSLTSAHTTRAGSTAHRRDLEQGVVYPTGRDAYENIQRHMDEQIAQQPHVTSNGSHKNGTSTPGSQQSYHPSQSAVRSATPPATTIQKNEQERYIPADISKSTTGSQQEKRVTPPPQQEKHVAAQPVQEQKRPTPPPVQQQKHATPPPVQDQKQPTPPPAQQQKHPTTAGSNVTQQHTQHTNMTQTQQGAQTKEKTPSSSSSSSNQPEQPRKLSTESSDIPKRKTSTGEPPSFQVRGVDTTTPAHEEIVRSKDQQVYAVVSAPADEDLILQQKQQQLQQQHQQQQHHHHHHQTTGTHVTRGPTPPQEHHGKK